MEKKDELLGLLYLEKIDKLKSRKENYEEEYVSLLDEKNELEQIVGELDYEIRESEDILYSLSTYKSDKKELVRKHVLPIGVVAAFVALILSQYSLIAVPISLVAGAVGCVIRYFSVTSNLRAIKKHFTYEGEFENIDRLMSNKTKNEKKIYKLGLQIKKLDEIISKLNVDINVYEYLYNDLVKNQDEVVVEIKKENTPKLVREKLENE